MNLERRIQRISERINRSYAGEHYGMQVVLLPRARRAVATGEIWQVGGDLCHVQDRSGDSWMVRSLYDQRQYTARDSEFLYFVNEDQ